MSSRDTILATIRRSLGVNGQERPRLDTVANRLATHPKGLIPQRGQLEGEALVGFFMQMVEASAATCERLPDRARVPEGRGRLSAGAQSCPAASAMVPMPALPIWIFPPPPLR